MCNGVTFEAHERHGATFCGQQACLNCFPARDENWVWNCPHLDEHDNQSVHSLICRVCWIMYRFLTSSSCLCFNAADVWHVEGSCFWSSDNKLISSSWESDVKASNIWLGFLNQAWRINRVLMSLFSSLLYRCCSQSLGDFCLFPLLAVQEP